MAFVDIRFIDKGNIRLAEKLGRLLNKTQRTIVFQSLRKEATRAKGRMIRYIVTQGLIDEGVLLKAYQKAKIRSTNRKGFIRTGIENPSREALGIHADDKYYYPYAVEFGHGGVPGHPFIRPAIDNHKDQSFSDIGNDIGKAIIKEALK